VNRTDRLMAILLELQARGEVRAEDLAETFEVSVRTVYRDVQALSESSVPVAATPGKGYRLMEGYFLPPLSFTADEATLLLLGGDFVRHRVDPELRTSADGALRKLAGVLPADRRAEVERRQQEMLFASLASAPDDPRLGTLRAAIRDGHAVRLLYHAYRRPGPEPRVVEPVRLLHMQDAWYVAGYCRLRRAPRFFRLDRVDGLDVLDERFALDERHHVAPNRIGDQPWPEAVVRFDPSVERWVRERQPFYLLREEQDVAGTRFVYALRDERELLTWLLSWGAAAEVLAPPSLRAAVAAEARAILARHAAETPRAVPVLAR
jgi:predicted DNA-binding transcriptional regulator YafY